MNHDTRKMCFCTQCQKAMITLTQNRGNAPKSQQVLWAVLEQRNKETKSARSLARN